MSLLIPEPPLIVLPSLAREVGLNEAIMLQQLYWLGQRSEGRWVQRSASEWGHALRGCFSARTCERILASLRKQAAVEWEEQPGKPTRYRVTSARLAEGSASLRGGPSPDPGGSASRVDAVTAEVTTENTSPKKVLTPAEEAIGFSEWLGFHHALTGSAVPRAGTARRDKLARIFAELVRQGAGREEFELESEGVFASPHMVEGGHLEPENVLRKTRFGEYAEKGRRARAAREAAATDVYGAFDGGDPRV